MSMTLATLSSACTRTPRKRYSGYTSCAFIRAASFCARLISACVDDANLSNARMYISVMTVLILCSFSRATTVISLIGTLLLCDFTKEFYAMDFHMQNTAVLTRSARDALDEDYSKRLPHSKQKRASSTSGRGAPHFGHTLSDAPQ